MNLECGGEKAWMRVVKINVADGDSCPSGWRKITTPTKACKAPSDNPGVTLLIFLLTVFHTVEYVEC